ncbi:MAG: hypothetical protein FH754_02830 [Marinobacter sp.]|nr:hypothetical protein [Marinobacter sp.]
MTWTTNSLRWFENLLLERFGHCFKAEDESNILRLTIEGSGKSLCIAERQAAFHEPGADFACAKWRPSTEGFRAPIADEIPAPTVKDLTCPLVEFTSKGAVVNYDIAGLIYWILNRLEEVGFKDLDEHERFPSTSSHAFRHGYLERPIVDEWLIILSQIMKHVWPQLEFKRQEFNIKVSHDVDRPSLYSFQSWPSIIRMMAGHLIKRGDLRSFLTALWVRITVGSRLHPSDPFNTFDWLMDISEKNGLTSAFYFISGRTDLRFDADYDLTDPSIRDLMRRIHKRGHEIGLHPSYGTYNQPDLIRQEFESLKNLCASEGIMQKSWGGRMHYLRWEQPTTLRACANAGLVYDTTMGYADRPGFRCGTCHEYTAFDPLMNEPISLKIRPLIVMECALMPEKPAGEFKINLLKERCKRVKGSFTLLWHNSSFNSMHDFCLYSKIIGSR